MAVTSYANDEDICIRAPGDFPVLCPKDQKIAGGSDGVFGSNSWTLTSASIPDWEEIGVEPGMVVQIVSSGANNRSIGESMTVDSVSGANLVLRRRGLASGVGMNPGGSAGLSSVVFLIATLSAQIEDASYDLNRRFGIDDLVYGRRYSDLYDPREVKQATVLEVLRRQYFALSRMAGNADDSFFAKAKEASNELNSLLGRVSVHWLASDGSSPDGQSTNRFSTRLSR